MADDHDFKSVRKNFFSINILIFLIAYSELDLSKLKFFNVEFSLSSIEIYTFLGLFFVYYAFRYWQESEPLIKKYRLTMSSYLFDTFLHRKQGEFYNARILKYIERKKEFEDRKYLIEHESYDVVSNDPFIARQISFSPFKTIRVVDDNNNGRIMELPRESQYLQRHQIPVSINHVPYLARVRSNLSYKIKDSQFMLLLLPKYVSIVTYTYVVYKFGIAQPEYLLTIAFFSTLIFGVFIFWRRLVEMFL
ncbi:MAG: hypothetical protein AAF391_05955 [Bacteroidota bacterium]